MNLASVRIRQHPLLAQGGDRRAHLNEGGGLCELDARCLRREGNGTRSARVCLDDVEGVGEQGELNVDQAAYADATRDRLGRGRDAFEFARGQRHGRQHAGGVT